MNRRGLGKGLGTGYKNLAPMDSHVHSLSAKGVKTQFKVVNEKAFAGKNKFRQVQVHEIYNGEVIGVPESDVVEEKIAKKLVTKWKKQYNLDAKGKTINKGDKQRALGSLRYQYGNKARELSRKLFNKNMEDLTTKEEYDELFKRLHSSNNSCPNCGGTHEDTMGVCPLAMERTPDSEGERDERDDGSWLDAKGKKSLYASFSAGTILQQLGGNRFIAMTGAKNFYKDDKKQMIGFKIGRNASNVNAVRITLNPKDLYDVEFLRVSVKGVKVKSKVDDVYFDQLQDVFTQETGMYTHL